MFALFFAWNYQFIFQRFNNFPPRAFIFGKHKIIKPIEHLSNFEFIMS